MYGSMKVVLKLDEILKQPEIFLTVKKLTSRVLISYGQKHTITELRKRQNKNKKIKEGCRINDLAKIQPQKFWQNIKKTCKKTQETTELLTVEELHECFKSTIGEATNKRT